MIEGLTFGIMRKIFLLIAVLSLTTSSWAQNNKRLDNYLIIPPEPKLYISSVDRYIAKKTGLSHAQIREGFRRELVKQLMEDFMVLGKTQTLLSDSSEIYQDLIYTYHSIGYKYEEVPQDETVEVKTLDKTKDKVSKTFNKLIPKKEDNTEELGPKREDKEHFMKTSIHSPYLLDNLHQKYGANRYVFINQMDIKDEPKSTYSYGTSEFVRVMRIHYTIMDQNGKILSAGLAKKEFSANLDNPKMIVKLTIPSISYFVTEKVRKVGEEGETQSEIDKL